MERIKIYKDNEFDLTSVGNELSRNKLNQSEGSKVLPVTSKGTCSHSLEGITHTHVVEANSARDKSVGAVISDYQP